MTNTTASQNRLRTAIAIAALAITGVLGGIALDVTSSGADESAATRTVTVDARKAGEGQKEF